MNEKFSNISKIFSKEWFENKNNEDHTLFILNKNKNYNKYYFDLFDKNLGVLAQQNVISKDLEDKLKNPPQFEDTLIEVQVASYLVSNNLKILPLGKNFPDIDIPELNTIIEVKNLHSSTELLDATGDYAVKIDDIKRIWDRILEKILDKLENKKINLVLINVPPEVEFDEFEDLFIFCERSKEGGVKYTINNKTKQIIYQFKGEFSKEENKKISAVIMLKDNHFRGLINSLNKKEIPLDIVNLFKINDNPCRITEEERKII